MTIANKAAAETLGDILLVRWSGGSRIGSASDTLVNPVTVPTRSLAVDVAESCIVPEPVPCFRRTI